MRIKTPDKFLEQLRNLLMEYNAEIIATNNGQSIYVGSIFVGIIPAARTINDTTINKLRNDLDET